MKARVVASFALLIALASRTSLAGEPDRLAAEALFAEGRTLLAQGKMALACEKFAASQKLDPSVGTMFNLAECSLRRGEPASAWLLYRDAAALAARNGDRDRERAALARADALVVPKLAIRSIAQTHGLTVRRDGATVDPTLLGVATPVNPGAHVIEASAPGHRPWRARVEVPASGSPVVVDIPALIPDEPAPLPHPAEATSSPRPLALILGGVSVVSLAAGVFFGLHAASTWRDVTDVCPDRHCPNAQIASDLDGKRHDAFRDSVISTVAVGVAVVAAATGAVLWWSGSPRTSPRVSGLNF
jgi:hypothetical protein